LSPKSFRRWEDAQIGGECDQVRIPRKLRKRFGKEPIRFWDDTVGIEKNQKNHHAQSWHHRFAPAQSTDGRIPKSIPIRLAQVR
jgi:hypothetical protein